MCGIIGFKGNGDVRSILLNSLSELEYRGYDSAGISYLTSFGNKVYKQTGKLSNLKESVGNQVEEMYSVGIGHTRWATHGKVTVNNAHPHLGQNYAVVHNGVIENHEELRSELMLNGVKFSSDTDSEVIVHLFEQFMNETNDEQIAFRLMLDSLEGSYAILLYNTQSNKDTQKKLHTHTQNTQKLFFAKKSTPLVVGLGKDSSFCLCSSENALPSFVNKIYHLEDGDFGFANDKVLVFDSNGQKEINYVDFDKSEMCSDMKGYRFFMEKEIDEQKEVIDKLIASDFEIDDLTTGETFDKVTVCACGTSYHAGLVFSYLAQKFTNVDIEIASEYRYSEKFEKKGGLFVAISQSGETADTIEAIKLAKSREMKIISIVNVKNSTIDRISDKTIYLQAGIERAVASTKAFSAQVLILWKLALKIGLKNGMLGVDEYKIEIEKLHDASLAMSKDFNVHGIVEDTIDSKGFFFIGRNIFYPLALEGALKLKELAYFFAEGYPAGEMKHGPISLADERLTTIALLSNNLYEKTNSNVEELKCRGSKIIKISPFEKDVANGLKIEQGSDVFEFFQMIKILQLIAMEMSDKLGLDVDMPRNLAKSVTVE